jgi:predicted Zn-ribbon and HTH transcriptional regulator
VVRANKIFLIFLWVLTLLFFAESFFVTSDFVIANGHLHVTLVRGELLTRNTASGEEWQIPILCPGTAMMLIGSLVLGIRAGSTRQRRERLVDANRCPHCGYDLRASPGRCPECGNDRHA